MARQKEGEAGETLIELQSLADSIGNWLRENWIWPAAALVGVIVVTGAVAGVLAHREGKELEASNALAAVQRQYLAAMGAEPGSTVFTEPANPETGKKARREAADGFVAVADEHPGTAAATLARIDAGTLLAEAGSPDRALELWREALADGSVGPELRAMLQVRVAQADEAAGRWAEAAKSYQEAGEQRAYPLWPWALADAARCLVEAGDRPAATRLAERLQADAPEAELPPHLSGLLDELRAGATPAAS